MRPRNIKGDGGIVFFYDENIINNQIAVMTIAEDDTLSNGKFINLEDGE